MSTTRTDRADLKREVLPPLGSFYETIKEVADDIDLDQEALRQAFNHYALNNGRRLQGFSRELNTACYAVYRITLLKAESNCREEIGNVLI